MIADIKRGEIHLALYLSVTLCIAQQNLSIGVNVVSKGSPSLILRVLLISLGITILPRSSTRRTMPVAFIIYLSPFLRRTQSLPCKGRWHGKAVTEGFQSPSLLRSQPPLQGGLSRAPQLFYKLRCYYL